MTRFYDKDASVVAFNSDEVGCLASVLLGRIEQDGDKISYLSGLVKQLTDDNAKLQAEVDRLHNLEAAINAENGTEGKGEKEEL